MKKKIKLRDLTEQQYKNWFNENCYGSKCASCPFNKVICFLENKDSWIKNKDLYSDKFLNQEIEIELELLTKEEKTYLENVLKPYKDRIIYIKKQTIGKNWAGINIKLESIIAEKLYDLISLPVFEKDNYYKNMVVYKEYTLKDLDLEH